jgi:hypothetical protein
MSGPTEFVAPSVMNAVDPAERTLTVKTERFLRPPQAVDLLRQKFGFGAVRSLAKMRVIGGGPPNRKLGRLVLYTRDDLIEWAQTRLSDLKHSTSETSRCANANGGPVPTTSSERRDGWLDAAADGMAGPAA